MGPGEAAFREGLRSAETPGAVRAELRRTGIAAGGQRAYLVAGALERHPAVVLGVDDPDALAGSLFTVAREGRAALDVLEADLGPRARALVVPDALNQLPVPSGSID